MAASVVQALKKRQENSNFGRPFQSHSYINADLVKRLGLEAELHGHNGCVNCLQWNTSGTVLASGSDDHRVILWDPFGKRILRSIETGHTNNIFSVQFVPNTNDNVLLSGAGDCRIRMHDINRPNGEQCIQIYSCHYARVKRLVVTPDEPQLFWTAGEDGIVMQFDTRVPANCERECSHCLINLNAHCGSDAEVKCIAINPCRPEQIAVGATDPFVRLFDRRMLRTRKITANNSQQEDRSLWERAYHPINITFTAPGENYDLPSRTQYFCPGHLPKKHEDYKKRYRPLATTHLTFSPCGNELLVNLGGEQIYLFDVNDKKKPALLAELSQLLDKLSPTEEQSISSISNGYHHNTNGFTSNGVTTNGVASHIHPFLSVKTVSEESKPKRGLAPLAEKLKQQANEEFEKQRYSIAVALYSQAIHISPDSPVLYANRAASYLKRNWDGDVYAALRDCHTTLQLDPSHVKALFRLARCLHDLEYDQQALSCLNLFKMKFSGHANSNACSLLEKEINNAIFKSQPVKSSKSSEKKSSETKKKNSRRKRRSEDSSARPKSTLATPDTNEEDLKVETPGPSRERSASETLLGDNEESGHYSDVLSEQEKQLRLAAIDYKLRFCGHCNTTTDIKEANYFGRNGEYIVAGSDDGSFFIWDRGTCNIVSVLRGDDSIVNCLQPHPTSCLLATSGIEPHVKLWSPRPEDGQPNGYLVADVDTTASANQRRMNADPFEVMLYNIGYRLGPDISLDSPGDWNVPAVQCRQS